MNSPDPVPNPPTRTGYMPTASTISGGVGGLVAIVILGVLRSYGHPLDEITASALTGALTLAANYFHPAGGRQ